MEKNHPIMDRLLFFIRALFGQKLSEVYVVPLMVIKVLEDSRINDGNLSSERN